MSSGFNWREEYERDPLNSDVVNMLFEVGRQDMGAYTFNRPIEAGPGEGFQYSSGDTNLMMRGLRRAIGKDYANFPWRKLFLPLRIDAVWERDASGTFIGSSNLYMRLRDWAKIGELINHRGVWKGRQIVSKSYMDYMLKMQRAPGRGSPPYGAQIWLDFPVIGLMSAIGYEGQFIIMDPQNDLVIVRLGMDQASGISPFRLYREAVSALGIQASGEDFPSGELPYKKISKKPKSDSVGDPRWIPIVARFRAKSLCSCFNVIKKEAAYCEAWTDMGFLPLPYQRNRQGGVDVGNPVLATANPTGSRYGCQ